MVIDLPTLMIAGSFVAAISGAFLIFAWLQTPGATAMVWWGAANMVLSAAIPLVAFPDAALGLPSVVVGICLLNVSPGLIWGAARASNRRRASVAVACGGGVLWLVAYAMPLVRNLPDSQLSLNLAIVSVFLFAAAWEFWRGRGERLTARWPLIVLLVLHGIFAAGGALNAALNGGEATAAATLVGWLAFVHFETLVFVVGTSIFAVALARERSEMQHRIAARTDDLTGVATRGAFYEEGTNLVERSLQAETELAIIAFDLDRFKSINDTFGHGPGDEVLKLFGEAAKATLRSSDLIGRLGGEEFGVVLPGATVGAAFIAAERIRIAFSELCASRLNQTITATVSAGIARTHYNSSFDSVMKAADEALYRAKLQGRDRVAIEGGGTVEVEDRAPETMTGAADLVRKVA